MTFVIWSRQDALTLSADTPKSDFFSLCARIRKVAFRQQEVWVAVWSSPSAFIRCGLRGKTCVDVGREGEAKPNCRNYKTALLTALLISGDKLHCVNYFYLNALIKALVLIRATCENKYCIMTFHWFNFHIHLTTFTFQFLFALLVMLFGFIKMPLFNQSDVGMNKPLPHTFVGVRPRTASSSVWRCPAATFRESMSKECCT